MRRVSYRPYIFLSLFFLSIFGMSSDATRKMRSFAIASVAPSWNVLKGRSFSSDFKGSPDELLMQTQMESMREWLLLEDRLNGQVDLLKNITREGRLKEFFKERAEEMISLIELHASSVLAPVIFREPSSWSSFVWIGVGSKMNERLKKVIVAKNSPVVVGHSLIGVVEEVGYSKSKVRLITDARLCPSVRVERGGPHNRFLLEHLEALILGLEARDDLREFVSGYKERFHALGEYLRQDPGTVYLAKGELHGSSLPLWRSRGKKIKGVGFNYSFPDAFGSAQNCLLKRGDLLVTTGLDGVFPSGLHVGVITQVHSPKEGASFYDLEAVLSSGSLDDLQNVFVLPPVN